MAKVKAVDKAVPQLTRKIVWWKCSGCGRKFSAIPDICSCKAPPGAFNPEYENLPGNIPREDFTVMKNVIYEGRHCNAGEVVSLPHEDPVTLSMVQRGLIAPVQRGQAPAKAAITAG